MKKQLSEKELGALIQRLVCEAGADDESSRQIADSPALWWGVQRQIADQKARSPWPPAKVVRRWLMIAVPAAAAIMLVASLFLTRPDNPHARTELVESGRESETPTIPSAGTGTTRDTTTAPSIESAKLPVKPPIVTARTGGSQKPASDRGREPKQPAAEVRSEFIALSYARSPESGQLVRVKVPRSMMVTLGLVAAVEKPNSLVDAEVVVGDDGTTHAIRFIR